MTNKLIAHNAEFLPYTGESFRKPRKTRKVKSHPKNEPTMREKIVDTIKAVTLILILSFCFLFSLTMLIANILAQ